MKVQTLLWVGVSSLLAAATWAAEPAKEKPAPKEQSAAKEAPAPADQKAKLPPGHPEIPAARPNLPAGHPDIGNSRRPAQPGGGGASLPPGHPQLPAGAGTPAAGDPSLPPGHPSVGASEKPKGPAATHGTIFVRAYQGTKDAPAIGAEPVSVELHHQGEVIQRLEGTLDQSGTVMFGKVPLARRIQPVVKVLHAGVEYQAVGEVMDGYHAGQQVDLPLYETTDAEPAWSVYMRHVIVEPTPEGARVTEVVALENPTDRSWLGAARSDGKRRTVAFDLPAGAEHFHFGGGGEASVKIEKGKLINTLPLMPGVSQVQFSYLVPTADDGKVRVKMIAPKAVKSMMVFVADTGAAVSAQGLQASGGHDMGPKGKALLFGCNNLLEGQPAIITLTPLAPAKKQKADAGSSSGGEGGSSDVARAVAGVGGGVGLVIGVGYVLLKPPAKARAI